MNQKAERMDKMWKGKVGCDRPLDDKVEATKDMSCQEKARSLEEKAKGENAVC